MSRGHMRVGVCFLVGFLSAAAMGDPYDDAVARAKEEGRYLVIVVHDDDCPDCKRLDETLQDAGVQQWIRRRGLLLRLSAAEPAGKKFSAAHEITTFPTVVLMTSEPRELGRQRGYTEPKGFLGALNRFAQGGQVRGTGGLKPWAGHDVVMSTIERAVALTTEGEFDKSLEELMWCFEHRASRSPVFAAQGLPKLLSALAKLGEQHPPARQALQNIMTAAKQETLRSRRPSTYALYTIKHGYLTRNDEKGLVAHYDHMKRAQPKGMGASDLARIIYGPLLNARRYEALRYSVNNPNETAMFFDQARRTGRDRNEVRFLMVSRYEVLLALGMESEATILAERLLRRNKSKKTHAALSEAALLSGHPTNADVTRARKVYMATDGGNARNAIVLAKLLAMKKPRSPEAIRIVRTGLNVAKSAEDRRALTTCLEEINSGKVEPTLPPKHPKP